MDKFLFLLGEGFKNLWRHKLTAILKEEELVVDLLPQVHRKSYINKDLNVVEVEFLILDKKQGKKMTAGHYGKSVKGEFIRYVAENNITEINDFSGFEYEGFKWDGEAFIRE